MSVPNQKVVYIHKRKYTGNFLQIGIDEMRLAQQQMTYCEFVLYLYLAGNANGFKLELSQQAFENTTGYKKTAYHNAVNKLIELGYLTQSYNYHYEFHTTPVRSSKLNFEVFFTVLPIYVDLTFSLLRCCYLLNPALLPTDNFLFISALHFSDKY